LIAASVQVLDPESCVLLTQVHFAEEWNEMHHLQIMEALGGDALWIDRFLAQHGAILYYWVLVGFYLLFPHLAYNFSELVESHASDTYAEFVDVRRHGSVCPSSLLPAACSA
jgi:ubiquinol oxidase